MCIWAACLLIITVQRDHRTIFRGYAQLSVCTTDDMAKTTCGGDSEDSDAEGTMESSVVLDPPVNQVTFNKDVSTSVIRGQVKQATVETEVREPAGEHAAGTRAHNRSSTPIESLPDKQIAGSRDLGVARHLPRHLSRAEDARQSTGGAEEVDSTGSADESTLVTEAADEAGRGFSEASIEALHNVIARNASESGWRACYVEAMNTLIAVMEQSPLQDSVSPARDTTGRGGHGEAPCAGPPPGATPRSPRAVIPHPNITEQQWEESLRGEDRQLMYDSYKLMFRLAKCLDRIINGADCVMERLIVALKEREKLDSEKGADPGPVARIFKQMDFQTGLAVFLGLIFVIFVFCVVLHKSMLK